MLEQYCSQLLHQLDQDLNSITQTTDNHLQRATLAVHTITATLTTLKNYVAAYQFTSDQQEIDFFKNLKPPFLGKLILYSTIQDIEANRHAGSGKAQRAFLRNYLSVIDHFHCTQADFIKYTRTGRTYLDHQYYLRSARQPAYLLLPFSFDADPAFSTSHDGMLASLQVLDHLVMYINTALYEVKRKKNTITQTALSFSPNELRLPWLGSRIGFVEVVYGLHSIGVFGQIPIAKVCRVLGEIFDIRFANLHATIDQLASRKKNPTAFLDEVREGLQRKINLRT